MIDLMINDPDAVCQAKYSGHKPADGSRALPEVKHAGRRPAMMVVRVSLRIEQCIGGMEHVPSSGVPRMYNCVMQAESSLQCIKNP
jgi:hypothetical protein